MLKRTEEALYPMGNNAIANLQGLDAIIKPAEPPCWQSNLYYMIQTKSKIMAFVIDEIHSMHRMNTVSLADC